MTQSAPLTSTTRLIKYCPHAGRPTSTIPSSSSVSVPLLVPLSLGASPLLRAPSRTGLSPGLTPLLLPPPGLETLNTLEDRDSLDWLSDKPGDNAGESAGDALDGLGERPASVPGSRMSVFGGKLGSTGRDVDTGGGGGACLLDDEEACGVVCLWDLEEDSVVAEASMGASPEISLRVLVIWSCILFARSFASVGCNPVVSTGGKTVETVNQSIHTFNIISYP
jgi:hypothetical protein